MKNYLKGLAEVIFPRYCLVCGKTLNTEEIYLCPYCLEEFPLTYFWQWKDNPAKEKFDDVPDIDLTEVISLFFYRYESPYKNIIFRIKYGGDISCGRYFGKILGEKLTDSYDYIIPVPTHFFKKWKRGYNQTSVIAKGLAEETGCEIDDNLIRRRKYSPSQTKLSADKKRSNVSEAFRVNKEAMIKLENKHIILLDDVLTSGSTLKACMNLLKEIKNLRITICTLAFVE